MGNQYKSIPEDATEVPPYGRGQNIDHGDWAVDIPAFFPPKPDNDDWDAPPPRKPVSSNPKRAFGIRKPGMQYVPPIALIEEAAVMGGGSDKYGPFNWNDQPVDATTYYSAIMRHVMAWYAGQDRDPESGHSHLAHVRACCGILIDAAATDNLIDDRPHTASVAEAIKANTRAA